MFYIDMKNNFGIGFLSVINKIEKSRRKTNDKNKQIKQFEINFLFSVKLKNSSGKLFPNDKFARKINKCNNYLPL